MAYTSIQRAHQDLSLEQAGKYEPMVIKKFMDICVYLFTKKVGTFLLIQKVLRTKGDQVSKTNLPLETQDMQISDEIAKKLTGKSECDSSIGRRCLGRL